MLHLWKKNSCKSLLMNTTSLPPHNGYLSPAAVVKRFNCTLKKIKVVNIIVSACSLLQEKRKELGDAASKLRNGLDKIDDTRAKVLTKEY